MTLTVEIVSQEKLVFREDSADMVLIPGTEGLMGILPRHAPVLTTLAFGEVIVRKRGAEERFAVYGGVADIRPDKVIVLAELAESSFELTLEAAEEARARAQKLLAEGIPPDKQREAVLELRRANLELQIARKLQQRGPMMRIIRDEEPKPKQSE